MTPNGYNMNASQMRDSQSMNHHGCIVELDGHGVLISGRSGSGKSSLALGLIQHFRNMRKSAFLVADDQYYLQAAGGNLVARAPESISGKVEIYGFGIVECETMASCRLDLQVTLVPDEAIDRMPEPKSINILGHMISAIEVPERHETQSVRIVVAKLNSLFE